jgi:hypothetical protein
MKGQGKDVHIFLPPFCDMEAELMLLLFDPNIWHDWDQMIKALSLPIPTAFWDQVRAEALRKQQDDLAPETELPAPRNQKQG